MNVIPTALYVLALTGTSPSLEKDILDCPSTSTLQECRAIEYINQINGNGFPDVVIYPTRGGRFEMKHTDLEE